MRWLNNRGPLKASDPVLLLRLRHRCETAWKVRGKPRPVTSVPLSRVASTSKHSRVGSTFRRRNTRNDAVHPGSGAQ
jgi:hypothetical protein